MGLTRVEDAPYRPGGVPSVSIAQRLSPPGDPSCASLSAHDRQFRKSQPVLKLPSETVHGPLSQVIKRKWGFIYSLNKGILIPIKIMSFYGQLPSPRLPSSLFNKNFYCAH